MTKDRNIRKATASDTARIIEIFGEARARMHAMGNTSQWVNGYPDRSAVEADMAAGGAFVVEERDTVVAYFAFLPSPEPTYGRIVGGEWIDDALPYHVVHRMAGADGTHGIFGEVMDFCATVDRNLRIDTHRDNALMRHCIEKHGFTYCGIIFLASGAERLAYQRLLL